MATTDELLHEIRLYGQRVDEALSHCRPRFWTSPNGRLAIKIIGGLALLGMLGTGMASLDDLAGIRSFWGTP